MKVLKFGGAIVGSAEHLKKVKSIVEAEKNPIVVVSAMDGVTDLLEEIVEEASTGDSKSIISRYEDLKTRHTELARQVVPADSQSAALSELNRLYAEMDSMLQALTIFRDWTDNILATFLSYGERLVSVIVGEMIGARVLDSTRFIIAEGDADCTCRRGGSCFRRNHSVHELLWVCRTRKRRVYEGTLYRDDPRSNLCFDYGSGAQGAWQAEHGSRHDDHERRDH